MTATGDHMTQTNVVLQGALDLIKRPGGWTQFNARARRRLWFDAYCLVGAIEHSAAQLDPYHDTYLPTRGSSSDGYQDAYDAVWRIVGMPLTGWNDIEGRTKKDVVSVLELAIQLNRSERVPCQPLT